MISNSVATAGAAGPARPQFGFPRGRRILFEILLQPLFPTRKKGKTRTAASQVPSERGNCTADRKHRSYGELRSRHSRGEAGRSENGGLSVGRNFPEHEKAALSKLDSKSPARSGFHCRFAGFENGHWLETLKRPQSDPDSDSHRPFDNPSKVVNVEVGKSLNSAFRHGSAAEFHAVRRSFSHVVDALHCSSSSSAR